jgi:hypothetical protein
MLLQELSQILVAIEDRFAYREEQKFHETHVYQEDLKVFFDHPFQYA